jgi:hypothetical protein
VRPRAGLGTNPGWRGYTGDGRHDVVGTGAGADGRQGNHANNCVASIKKSLTLPAHQGGCQRGEGK